MLKKKNRSTPKRGHREREKSYVQAGNLLQSGIQDAVGMSSGEENREWAFIAQRQQALLPGESGVSE